MWSRGLDSYGWRTRATAQHCCLPRTNCLLGLRLYGAFGTPSRSSSLLSTPTACGVLPRGTLIPCLNSSLCTGFPPCEFFRSSCNCSEALRGIKNFRRASALFLSLCCCCLFDKYFDLLSSRKRPCHKTRHNTSQTPWGQDLAARSDLARPFRAAGNGVIHAGKISAQRTMLLPGDFTFVTINAL